MAAADDTYQTLTTGLVDHVLTVTLDRPAALNAITQAMADELRRLLAGAAADDAVRVLVLTGAGRGFCAGADLSEIASKLYADGEPPRPAQVRDLFRQSSAPVALALLGFDKPVVAAVNGPCAGAGLGLALCADVCVASEAASFSLAFTRRGLVPDYLVTWLLPRLIGLRAARELCLLGETVDAPRAVTLGLVRETAPADALAEVADAYARRLADGAGVALRLTKTLLARSPEVDAAAAVDAEFTAQSLCFASADAQEGMTAFLQKREPRFTWT